MKITSYKKKVGCLNIQYNTSGCPLTVKSIINEIMRLPPI